MDRTSISQEYLLLVLDKNGYIPPMRREESNAGLTAACFMDLLLNEIITVNKKQITVTDDLPQELAYLTPIYTYLREKNRSVSKMMTDYAAGVRLKPLMTEIGEAMAADGMVSKGEGGLFGTKVTYFPDKSRKEELLAHIKSAAADQSKMTAHDMALIFLLQKTKNLNQYFSKYEWEQWKTVWKDIKKDPQNKQLSKMIDELNDWITVVLAAVLMYI
nr:GPP34 family phosphoprotein [uncultured Anaerostipes sp.]